MGDEKGKSGNKGEWGELYAFLYTLANGVLQDKNGNTLNVSKIRRYDKDGHIDYEVNKGCVFFKEAHGCVTTNDLKEKLPHLFREISTTQGRTFECPQTSAWMRVLDITQIKSSARNKDDFSIQFQGQDFMGYNVKSLFASSPGIINASQATNFIYKVSCNLSDAELNSLEAPKKIIQAIYNNGGSVEFWKCQDDQFKENLVIPEIFALLVVEYFKSKEKFVKDLVDSIFGKKQEVLDKKKPFWVRNISKILVDSGSDLRPSKVPEMSTENDASGGLLFVKKDGTVVCDRYTHKKDASRYLYEMAFLDTASTTRHGFGEVYYEDGVRAIKLNLNIKESTNE